MTTQTVGDHYRPADDAEALELPDKALFWRWVWSAVRPVLGWVLVAAGALALFLGWYGVSGEALPAKQLPYLVSGGLTGIGLIIVAGVFLATDDVRRQFHRIDALERKVDELYALLVEDGAPQAEPAVELVALPGGTTYHRRGCTLVGGKPAAAPVTVAQATARGLRPCRLCDPPA